jgi:hypothetical protein
MPDINITINVEGGEAKTSSTKFTTAPPIPKMKIVRKRSRHGRSSILKLPEATEGPTGTRGGILEMLGV